MAKVIYQRVSSVSQEFLRQEHLFSEKGIVPDKVFEEKISGKDSNRPKLREMLAWVRGGDVVYVESISRLARNIRDLLWIVDELQKKEVELVSLKENIDTSSPTGKFLLSVMGAMAELERDTIRQRQQEAYEARRSKGLPIGRPKVKLSKTFSKNYSSWKEREITAVQFMEREGMKKSTFYRVVKRYDKSLL